VDDDVLWLLNPDTEILGDGLAVLEAELDRGEHALVSPVIVSGTSDAPWLWYAGGTLDVHKMRVQHLRYGTPATALSESEGPFVTEYVTGAAPMLRAGTFRAAGGFPDHYFLYWEDALLSWKVREAGHSLAVVPGARIWHAVGASSGSGQSATFYYWSPRNRVRFATDLGQPAWRLVVGAGASETLRVFFRALKEPSDRGAKLLAALRGTAHGLRDARAARRGRTDRRMV
jgi:GT2 family glycosyltransferase